METVNGKTAGVHGATPGMTAGRGKPGRNGTGLPDSTCGKRHNTVPASVQDEHE